MLIRKAIPEDAEAIAPFLMLAMRDIVFYFIGENSSGKANKFLAGLIKERGNQYSYENCFVAEVEGQVTAAAIVYNGGDLTVLREPVLRNIKLMFNRVLNIEDETQPGEYYIDCVAVAPYRQGHGIGTVMFEFLINEFVHKQHQTLGLLVDKQNPGAKKLYLKLGFKIVGEKMLAGIQMEHLQINGV